MVIPPIARGQTWLFQPLPVSTVPNTGRNQSDSGYRGLDEDGLHFSDEYLVQIRDYQIILRVHWRNGITSTGNEDINIVGPIMGPIVQIVIQAPNSARMFVGGYWSNLPDGPLENPSWRPIFSRWPPFSLYTTLLKK